MAEAKKSTSKGTSPSDVRYTSERRWLSNKDRKQARHKKRFSRKAEKLKRNAEKLAAVHARTRAMRRGRKAAGKAVPDQAAAARATETRSGTS